MISPRYFLYFFYFAAIVELVSIYLNWDIRMLSKPLVMISLITYFLTATRKLDLTHGLFLLALAAALAGDIFLLSDRLFLPGLLSFLTMQILYCICFLRGKNFWGRREYSLIAILMLVVLFVMSQLYSHLGTMTIPVFIYTSAIAAMSITAFSRDYRYAGYWAVFAGTVFFILSDSALGIQKFASIDLGPLTVMGTYIIAQYLIVTGYVKYLQNR